MKKLHQGIALLSIAAMSLVGCGGGSGSASNGGAAVATTSSTITPFKGPFYSGANVVLKDASGNPVTLTSGGTVNASGVINVSYPSTVSYPLIVEVIGSYYNEITGKAETATVPLRGLITSAAGASNVPVTLVTEAAVADLQNRLGAFSVAKPIQAASAVAALTAAGNMLGIPATAVPVFDPITNKTADANTLRLAAMAVIANGQIGATLAEKVKALVNSLVTNSTAAPTALISQTAYNAALTAMTSGASSVMATGATAPTPPTISASSYATLYAAAGGGATTPPATSPAATACKAAGGMWDPFTNFCIPATVTNPCPAGQILSPLNVCVPASSVPATPVVSAVPAAPTGVTATAISANQINLSWAAVTGANGYYVYRSVTAGLPVASMVNVTAPTGPVTVGTTLNDAYALLPSTAYYYKVVALNAAGASVASVEVMATTSAPAVTIPAAPAGVTATVASANQINLSWTAVTGATGYNVYRASAAGTAIVAANKLTATPITTATFSSTGLTAATPYFYKVTALNAAGESVGSAEVTATTSVAVVVPPVTPVAGLMGGAKQGTPLALASTVSTFAGSTAFGSLNGVGGAATFNQPRGITTDGTNLYVIDTASSLIRIINIATGAVTTLNTPAYNAANPTGLMAPQDITTDGTYLYVANSYHISKIVIATGVSSILAGSATAFGSTDGVGAAARFFQPYGITTDGKNLYVAELGNNKIRQIVIATGVVTTLAGSGVSGTVDGVGAAATFTGPRGITTDGTNLYVAEAGTAVNIRKIVIATGVVTTLAGTYSNVTVNGIGTAATFMAPTGITTDGTNLYIADAASHLIRKIVIATGTVTTLAGTGMCGAVSGTGTAASFCAPSGIITDGISLYVSDLTNNMVRKIQ